MNQKGKKEFWDYFKNPDGSYHIPIWLIVLGFMINWMLGVGLLIAHICEEGGTKTTRREVPYAPDDGPAVYESTAEAPKPKAKKKPKSPWKKKSPAGILTGLGIFAVFVGAFSLPDSIQYLVWCINDGYGISYGVQDVAEDVIWVISGLVMLLAGELMRRSAARRKKIAAIVGNAKHMHISEIAEALPASRSRTERYLQQCIDRGMFGDKAYLDMRSDYLVISGPAPMSRREQAEKAMAEEAARRAEENMDEYSKILRELREINDRIPGEEFSAKIDRLEDLTAKIFKVVKDDPDKQGKMRKFINYYLPTSLKLLRQYEQLDAQGIEGKNISESKRQIEETMDTMIEAYEKQLDTMFAAESMDISADIAAMQNLMRADGLLDNGLTDKFE